MGDRKVLKKNSNKGKIKQAQCYLKNSCLLLDHIRFLINDHKFQISILEKHCSNLERDIERLENIIIVMKR